MRDLHQMIESNTFVASAIARPYSGQGTMEDPLKVEPLGVTSREPDITFRKLIFEALLQAATRIDGSCFFVFNLAGDHLYRLKLDDIPDMTSGAAVDFAHKIVKSRMTHNSPGKLNARNTMIRVSKFIIQKQVAR